MCIRGVCGEERDVDLGLCFALQKNTDELGYTSARMIDEVCLINSPMVLHVLHVLSVFGVLLVSKYVATHP